MPNTHKNRSPEASAFYTAGLILLGIVVAAFIVSLFWTPYAPDATDAASKLVPPSLEHPFGTDNFGRDVLSRVMSASKYTIFISAAGVAIALILGTVAGIPAGYYGGFTDRGIMLLGNSIMCFPGILLALVAVAVFGPSVTNVIWALGLVFAPTFARVCRHHGNKRTGLYNPCACNGSEAGTDNGIPHIPESGPAASSCNSNRPCKYDSFRIGNELSGPRSAAA